MEEKRQQIKELKEMLATGLVKDETIIAEAKATIAKLKKELEASTEAKAAQTKKEQAKPNKQKTAKINWKKPVSLKKLKPVVLHCQHYQMLVTKQMEVGIKGSGNHTNKIKVYPGEHLIFDDRGQLIFVMNADSFARKCNEAGTVEEHIQEKHKSETSTTAVEAKAEKKADRRSPVTVLEAEIKDVAKIVAKGNITKEDAKKLPAELKDIGARAMKTSTINYIKAKAKKIEEGKPLSKAEVVKLALAAQPLVQVPKSILIDLFRNNRKVLEPTTDGLLRWLTNPDRYDLQGVDISPNAKVTVKPKRPQKTLLQILKIQD